MIDSHDLRVLPVDPASPSDDRLARAVEVLSRGGLVALPTETFYGIAADAFQSEALARVNRLKGKAANEPVLLLVADVAQAGPLCDSLPPLFEPLTGRFWPGPLTLVVPASSRLPREATGGRGTVALRMPGLALPRRLAAALGRPLSGVSANRSGQPPCRSAGEVAEAFPEGLELILDGGAAPGGAPSTIVDLTRDPPRVLREGLLPLTALAGFLEGSSPAE